VRELDCYKNWKYDEFLDKELAADYRRETSEAIAKLDLQTQMRLAAFPSLPFVIKKELYELIPLAAQQGWSDEKLVPFRSIKDALDTISNCTIEAMIKKLSDL